MTDVPTTEVMRLTPQWCPFCPLGMGKVLGDQFGYWMQCDRCECQLGYYWHHGSPGGEFDSEGQAIRAWNTRSSDGGAARAALVEWLVRECGWMARKLDETQPGSTAIFGQRHAAAIAQILSTSNGVPPS